MVWDEIMIGDRIDLQISFRYLSNTRILFFNPLYDHCASIRVRLPVLPVHLMQDNACRAFCDILVQKRSNIRIEVLQYPAQSPNLNPIKHVLWDML